MSRRVRGRVAEDRRSSSTGVRCGWPAGRSGATSSMKMARGEFVALLGANGSGKSTLLKVVLGRAGPAAGRLSVLGRPAGAGEPGDRLSAPTALVRQGSGCAASTSCGSGSTATAGGCRCRCPGPPGRGARARTCAGRRGVELVGASAYAQRSIGECSGGEQQRLLIAQALVRRPELLLLDEPLDSLDLPNQAAVAALVDEICRERGVGVLLVAHDVNPLLPYLDRVVYLAGGRAVEGSVRRGDHRASAERAVRPAGRGAAGIRRPAGRRRPARGAGPPPRPPRPRMTRHAELTRRPAARLERGARRGRGARIPLHGQRAAGGQHRGRDGGLVGWMMVMRREAFAGHTLSMMAFPGASGAALLGVPAGVGIFRLLRRGRRSRSLASRGRAELRGASSRRRSARCRRSRSPLGFLFVSLYGGVLGDLENLLFGDVPRRLRRPGARAARAVAPRRSRSSARWPAAAVRLRRRGRGARPRRAGAGAFDGVLAAARPGGRRRPVRSRARCSCSRCS